MPESIFPSGNNNILPISSLQKSTILSAKAGADIQVVFVHGGGSIPMKGHSQLRVKLEDKLRSYNGGYTVPALWIPAPFAQTLNRDGLVYLVDHAA